VDIIVTRRTFTSVINAIAAQRAESFIAGQTHGAGTWEDHAEIPISDVVNGAVLRVIDKIGTDRDGAQRHIQLRRGNRVIVTFVYSQLTRELVRTF